MMFAATLSTFLGSLGVAPQQRRRVVTDPLGHDVDRHALVEQRG